jgi:hypothetical protein
VQKSLLANKVLVVVVLKDGRRLKVQRCQVVVTCTWGARATWLPCPCKGTIDVGFIVYVGSEVGATC